MERGVQMAKRKTPVWLKILMLGFLLYAAVMIIDLHTQIAGKQTELDTLNLQIEEYRAVNDALRQEMQKGISENDISEIARTELSYAQPGERVFVDTSSR